MPLTKTGSYCENCCEYIDLGNDPEHEKICSEDLQSEKRKVIEMIKKNRLK